MTTNEIRTLAENLQNLTTRYELAMETVNHNTDVFFLLSMSIVIFLMQCGFAFLEAGSVRSKNATNILIKNVLDPCFAAVAYWVCGWAFAYGTPSNPFIGYGGFLGISVKSEEYHLWFFQFVFAATASTIVSGSVAERCEFSAYVVYCTLITGFIYPVLTHWAWSDTGWLKHLGGHDVGFVDFAGSGIVHLCGGTCALVGTVFLGPRIGRFSGKDYEVMDIKGHSVPMAALGGFILLFGFFAFNGGSQGHISKPGDGEAVATAMSNTVLSGAMAALTALVIGKFQSKKFSLLLTLNGSLAGMVSICAGCDAYYSWSACVVGVVAGANYSVWSYVVLRMKIDDPLDAVAVHAGGGLWGLLAAPIFHNKHGIVFYFSQTSFLFFAWNLVGAVVIIVWSGLLSVGIFGLLKLTRILRVTEEIELKGLDIIKHGEPAYPLVSYGHGWGEPWNDVINWGNVALTASSKTLQVIHVASPTGNNSGRNAIGFHATQSEPNLLPTRNNSDRNLYEHPEMEWRENEFSRTFSQRPEEQQFQINANGGPILHEEEMTTINPLPRNRSQYKRRNQRQNSKNNGSSTPPANPKHPEATFHRHIARNNQVYPIQSTPAAYNDYWNVMLGTPQTAANSRYGSY